MKPLQFGTMWAGYNLVSNLLGIFMEIMYFIYFLIFLERWTLSMHFKSGKSYFQEHFVCCDSEMKTERMKQSYLYY